MELREMLPCIADPTKYRVIGRIDVENLQEVLPYLVRLVPNAVFSKKNGWVSFKKGQRIITIHEDGFVTMTHVTNRDEAEKILTEIERKAIEAWRRRNEIDLTEPPQKSLISALDIYNFLPKTNCRRCGELTCMAFAVKLLNGEVKVTACKPLFNEEKYIGVKETLISLLISAGYEVEV